MSSCPERIVCLSAEAADWLWRIGAWEQVVGVTTFFKQPPEVDTKPRVSGFSTARMEAIAALKPDLVITFSDVQAKLGASLVQRGFTVFSTNQRTLEETEHTLAMLGRIVGREHQAEEILNDFRNRLAPVVPVASRPRVYFEEWPEPLISGIAWVSELIERAGGKDIFEKLRTKRSASERVVTPGEVIAADPQVILASWCGKPVDIGKIALRPNWNQLSAVREERIYEISANDILQPGFRLVYAYAEMQRAMAMRGRD